VGVLRCAMPPGVSDALRTPTHLLLLIACIPLGYDRELNAGKNAGARVESSRKTG